MGEKKQTSIDIADPFARQLVARYLARRTEDLETLKRALERSDFDSIQTAGHKLSGSGSAYGLHEVSRIGRAIELSADRKDSHGVRQQLDALAGFVSRVKIT